MIKFYYCNRCEYQECDYLGCPFCDEERIKQEIKEMKKGIEEDEAWM